MSSNYFTTFNFTNAKELNLLIHTSDKNEFTEPILRDLLHTENVNFVLSGINRLQSMLICELGLSYVQQSQRYVSMSSPSFTVSSKTPVEVAHTFQTLVDESIDLYNEMTELTDPNKKGRLTNKDFKYGISYEDARYILPVNITTNLTVTCTGDKLIDIFKLFNKYQLVFNDLKNELMGKIPSELLYVIDSVSHDFVEKDKSIADKYYRHLIKGLNNENIIKCLDIDDMTKQIAIGALASQNKKSPDIVYSEWDKDIVEEKESKLIKNVVGYGHTAILEQGRSRFAMQCSVSAYHQVIRHRLQSIRRMPVDDILTYGFHEYMLPKSIQNNDKFFKKAIDLIARYVEIYQYFAKKYDHQFLMQYILNCAPMRFIVSSNIRNDNWIFRERLCYTAQEEIRNLYRSKYEMLEDAGYHVLVKYGLPPCVAFNQCKEGKMNCGRIVEARKEYEKYNY